MNLLKFYRDCMRTGRLPFGGLCNSLPKQERQVLKDLLSPDMFTRLYWAHSGEFEYLEGCEIDEILYSFTPLRQTLVLLLNEIMKDLKKEKS